MAAASADDRRAPRGFGLLLAVALAGGCGKSEPPPPQPPPPAAPAQVGAASYYAEALAGRPTASGELYHPGQLTAAHRTLPLGTVVTVTRIDGSGARVAGPVTVRINDRGPYVGDRILDLSLAAARRLDMIRSGVVRVRVQVVSSAPGRSISREH